MQQEIIPTLGTLPILLVLLINSWAGGTRFDAPHTTNTTTPLNLEFRDTAALLFVLSASHPALVRCTTTRTRRRRPSQGAPLPLLDETRALDLVRIARRTILLAVGARGTLTSVSPGSRLCCFACASILCIARCLSRGNPGCFTGLETGPAGPVDVRRCPNKPTNQPANQPLNRRSPLLVSHESMIPSHPPTQPSI